jgi:hypothetical protein
VTTTIVGQFCMQISNGLEDRIVNMNHSSSSFFLYSDSFHSVGRMGNPLEVIGSQVGATSHWFPDLEPRSNACRDLT